MGATGLALYGRKLWETMSSHWPTADQQPGATPAQIEFARRWRDMPKVVFSSTTSAVDWNARLVTGDAVTEITRLKTEDGGPMDVGGATLAAAAMRAGLIDEYAIVTHPVLVGRGTPSSGPGQLREPEPGGDPDVSRRRAPDQVRDQALNTRPPAASGGPLQRDEMVVLGHEEDMLRAVGRIANPVGSPRERNASHPVQVMVMPSDGVPPQFVDVRIGPPIEHVLRRVRHAGAGSKGYAATAPVGMAFAVSVCTVRSSTCHPVGFHQSSYTCPFVPM